MIGRLSGTLAEKNPPQILVDVGGVGYEVLIPLSSFDRLPERGGDLTGGGHGQARFFEDQPNHQLFRCES